MKEELWNCRKCNIEIGGHNQYLHDGMCDDCYFREYFPEDQAAYEKRIIKKNGKSIDPIGLSQEEFEREFGLTEYIETKEGKEDKLYIDAFFKFLERNKVTELFAYNIYDEEINEALELSFEEIKKNLYLEYQEKGFFYNDDLSISQAFTDKKDFFAIVQKGIIFFSGNSNSSRIMQDTLKDFEMDFYIDSLSQLK